MSDVGSAYKIIKLKGYTSWAIGIMVSTLCSAILRNQRQLYTLSTNAQACALLLYFSVTLSSGLNVVNEKWQLIFCISRQNIKQLRHVVKIRKCKFEMEVRNRYSVFTTRCYASTLLAMDLCLSVRPSVRLSQVGVLLKWLNVGSHKQHHMIAHGLSWLVCLWPL